MGFFAGPFDFGTLPVPTGQGGVEEDEGVLMMGRPKWLLIGAFACAAFCSLPLGTVHAKDGNEVISVEKDKDKTSYIIRGSNEDTEKEQTDRAWEMLDRAIIDTRGCHGKGPDNHR